MELSGIGINKMELTHVCFEHGQNSDTLLQIHLGHTQINDIFT